MIGSKARPLLRIRYGSEGDGRQLKPGISRLLRRPVAGAPDPKILKKSLAMPAGIVKNGLILRDLGGYMPKFKRFSSHSLRFSSLLILTGALILLAAVAPRANADLIAYYNFEGPDSPGFPVNLESKPPAVFFTSDNELQITATNLGGIIQAGGLPFNVAPGDLTPNVTGLGFNHSGQNSPLEIVIPLHSPQGFFQDMTLSFAINALGNGFNSGSIAFSTNGGATWTTFFSASIPSAGTSVVSVAVPTAANNAPSLELRIELTGGQSNGANLQNIIDNIQVNGTIVPEPATVAGGLFGVLGLCWFQRRRLIRAVRFRRA